MQPVMLDTSQAETEAYYARLRAAGLEGRARITWGLCGSVRALAEAGIRRDFPHYSDAEVRAELTARLYGDEVARRLHGPSPSRAP